MFTQDDIDKFVTPNPNRDLGGYATAAWVDSLGNVHHVDWHSNLSVKQGDRYINGYDAFQYGWMKVYMQPNKMDTAREFGFQAKRLLNDSQVDFCIAACEALNADSVVGQIADTNIFHQGNSMESTTDHLRKRLPHS